MLPTIGRATNIAVKVHSSGVVKATTDHTLRAGGPLGRIDLWVLFNWIPLCPTEGLQLQGGPHRLSTPLMYHDSHKDG